MKCYIKMFSATIALLFCVTLRGEAQNAISLEDCKQKALEHNQTIKSKEASYRSGEASVKLSKKASLPAFDLTAGYTYQNDPMQMVIPGFELPTVAGGPSGVYYPGGTTNLSYHNSYNANIGMSLPIYLGGKLSEARTIAAHSLEIAESDVALSKTDLLLSIEQQYWSLVSLLEQEKVTAKAVLFLGDMLEDMNNRYTFGVVTKNEVLKTKVELNNAKLFQINIANNITLAKMALNQSIGLDIESPLVIADSIIKIPSNLDMVEYSAGNILKRNEINILNKQLDINRSEEEIIRSDYRPEFVSFANYTLQNPNHISKAEAELTWTAGLSLSMPLFHWGERKLKIEQAKMTMESTVHSLDYLSEMITLEMQQSIFRLRESLMKLEFTADALEQSEENLSLESDRLEEEIATTTDLLNAQSQWQKAHADFIAAKTEVKISEAQYYKSIGELNP